MKTYELKHKHGSFHDFETELFVNRDEQVEIDEETAGKATLQAIANGRLVVVTEARPKAKAKAGAAGNEAKGAKAEGDGK